jgi:hypothetical protein
VFVLPPVTLAGFLAAARARGWVVRERDATRAAVNVQRAVEVESEIPAKEASSLRAW